MPNWQEDLRTPSYFRPAVCRPHFKIFSTNARDHAKSIAFQKKWGNKKKRLLGSPLQVLIVPTPTVLRGKQAKIEKKKDKATKK